MDISIEAIEADLLLAEANPGMRDLALARAHIRSRLLAAGYAGPYIKQPFPSWGTMQVGPSYPTPKEPATELEPEDEAGGDFFAAERGGR